MRDKAVKVDLLERRSVKTRTLMRHSRFRYMNRNFEFPASVDRTERFVISQVEWKGNALSFVAHMPSTNHTTRNVFRLRAYAPRGLEEEER
jgi:hypothetical protein